MMYTISRFKVSVWPLWPQANHPTIEKNVKSLNINTFDCEYEVDPLFKKTTAAFDEGGVEGLLINQLHTG